MQFIKDYETVDSTNHAYLHFLLYCVKNYDISTARIPMKVFRMQAE